MLMPMEITAPNIEYGLLAPVLLIFAGACVGVLVEAVAPARDPARGAAGHDFRVASRPRWRRRC